MIMSGFSTHGLLQTTLLIGLWVFQATHTHAAEKQLTYGSTATINSKAFASEREYYVHLPENYEKDSNKTYPVIYVLHGQ